MATDPNLIDMGLPPEYLAALEQAQRRQQIAQGLLAQTQKGVQVQQIGPVAAKISPWAIAANGLAGGLAQMSADREQQNIQGVKQKFSADQNAAMQEYLAQSAETRLNKGLASPFPLIQQQAQKDRAETQAMRKAAIDAAGRAGDTDAAVRLAGIKDYTPKEQKPPEFFKDPSGNAYSIEYDKHGVASVKYAPKGVNVQTDIKLPGKEADMALDALKVDLKTRQGKAEVAKSMLASNAFAADALAAGAQTGGGEGIKQGVRKALQAFNISAPDTASTEQLSMALGTAVLSNAEKIRPASDTDIKVLRDIVGQIGTDPTALTKALAFANAISLRDMHTYNQYVTEQTKNLQSPYARDLFSGAGIGYEMPGQLNGPEGLQFETVKQYQNMGGDPSIFKIAGQPVQQGTQFNVNPLRGQNPANTNTPPGKKVVRTGTSSGRKVVQYSDGSVEYAPGN